MPNLKSIQTDGHVLVVDDSREMQLVLNELINEYLPSLQVSVASSGKKAIQMAQSIRPDLIILDITLPDMLGFEVCAKIKQINDLKPIPVVFLTGTGSEPATRIQALEAGGEVFLTKPFNKLELIALIKLMLQVSEARQLLVREKYDLDILIEERTKALQQSELNYRMLFDHATIGIVIQQDGLVKLCNNKVCSYLGYTTSELIGQPYINFVHPDDRALLIEKHAERMQSKIPLSKYEFRFLTKNGGFIWVETESVVLEWAGKPAVLGFLNNINDQVDAQKKLIESEERYRNIFNKSSIGIYQTTPEGTYCTVNYAFAQIFGFNTPEEMISTVKDIGQELYSNPEDRLRLIELLNPDAAEVSNFETQARKHDGSMVWILINARKFVDAASGKSFFEGTCMDITEKKLAQIALQQHNKLMKSMTDAAQDAILMMDHDGLISYWNPAAERIFGYSEKEALGKNLHQLIAPTKYHQAHSAAFKVFLETGGGNAVGRTLELEAWRKDGQAISVELSLSAVLINENWHSTGIIRDITQRKGTELELKLAKERAEESDKLKTAFLNNISHEIRTPFNGILGFISMLLDEEFSKEEKAEFVEVINMSAERLMTTINNIVEMSRLQSSHLELKLSEFKLSALFDDILYQFKAAAAKKGLSLLPNNQLEGLDDLVNTDRDVLNYVLSHLINNAIKFTNAGSVEFGAEKLPNGIKVYVKDTGIGIPLDRQKDIFKHFTQADFSSTRQFEGSGLGLSIAASYVANLHSEIRIESEQGKGSVFYFILPKSLVNKQVETNLSPNKEVSSHPNVPSSQPILIAEDDDVSRDFVAKVLARAGYTCILAQNGQEAVDLFIQNPEIPLVVMDIRMPELDGFEATKAIRRVNGQVPIIALTAYTLSDERRQAFEAGCNECLKKPIGKDQILEMVKKYL